MTNVEQKKIIAELRDYENAMSKPEHETFRMYVKRNKDDEDLDTISKTRLMQLYEKYVVSRPKKTVKSPFGDIIKR